MVVMRKALLLALALALCPDAIRCPRVKTVVENIAMRNCTNGGPTLSNYFHNVKIIQERRDFNYMTTDLIIGDPGTNVKWKISVYRCMQRDALIEQGECEFFLKIVISDSCGALKMKNQMWSTFFNSSEPPFVCPLTKGVYKFRKVFFDVDKISKFASGIPFIQNYFWVSRADARTGKKPWSCMEYVFKLVNVKG